MLVAVFLILFFVCLSMYRVVHCLVPGDEPPGLAWLSLVITATCLALFLWRTAPPPHPQTLHHISTFQSELWYALLDLVPFVQYQQYCELDKNLQCKKPAPAHASLGACSVVGLRCIVETREKDS